MWRLADPRRRGYAIVATILLVGLISAVVIYLRAANVLAVEFMTWFDGLWHGRSVAYTVAVISLLLAASYPFFAVILPPYAPPEPSARDDHF
ncbi:MAG: hypothetical protein ACHQQS_03480 [Thermoanaerobaculales bacterium]